MIDTFTNFYRGKKVFVTGHTGFKGSWLTIWLKHLGAQVIGYALEPPTQPNNFTACCLMDSITHIQGDIRDLPLLEKTMQLHQPDLVFHLAAQSLVRRSFHEPVRTFEVNLMGTVNVMEACRRTESVEAAVIITSDKCYQNVGWDWGYREIDSLGGFDAYSASKASAELAVACYRDSRFQLSAPPYRKLPIASARAGNVIGGGDWASHRIVPDIIKAIVAREDIVVRQPEAVRPWQHVLEPLSGYLLLGALLPGGDQFFQSPWNFGPGDGGILTVAELVKGILERWPGNSTNMLVQRDNTQDESLMLRLDCSKARQRLGWRAVWDMPQTFDAITSWYQHYYLDDRQDMHQFALSQIHAYSRAARQKTAVLHS